MRRALSGSGLTRRSRSPVNRGAPWNASAYPPTTMYSTRWALNNPSNSLKSGCASIVLPAQIVDGGDAFLRRPAQPVGQVAVLRDTLSQASFCHDLLDHVAVMLLHVLIAGTIFCGQFESKVDRRRLSATPNGQAGRGLWRRGRAR